MVAFHRYHNDITLWAISILDGRPAPTSAPDAIPSGTPGPLALVNPSGIYSKVLITDEGLRPLEAPDSNSSTTGDLIPRLSHLYIFAYAPSKADPEFVEVGFSPEEAIGWISYQGTIRADHRLGLYPLHDALIFASKVDAEAYAQGQVGVQPIGKASREERLVLPWPVIDSDYTQVGGQPVELLKIAFLGRYANDNPPIPKSETKPYSTEEMEDIRSGLQTLQVVFVVDNTASTEPLLANIREALFSTVKDLSAIEDKRGKVNLQLGLVLYRDCADPEGPVLATKGPHAGKRVSPAFDNGEVVSMHPFTSNSEDFISRIATLKPTDIDSGDPSECVYDGVLAALGKDATPSNNIDWGSSGLSTKILILVGDAPGHPKSSLKNIHSISEDSLTKIACEKKIRIFSLPIKNPNYGPEEHALQLRQFTTLANDSGGECFPLEKENSIAEMVGNIESMVASAWRETEDHTQNLEILRSSPAAVDSADLSQTVRLLRSAGIEIERLGRDGSNGVHDDSGLVCAGGWAVPIVKGSATFQKLVLYRKSELTEHLGRLYILENRLDPRSAIDLAVTSIKGSTGQLGVPDIDYDRARNGIPMATAGILAMSSAQLAALPDSERSALRSKVTAAAGRMNAFRSNSSNWHRLGDTEFGWIPVSDLP